MFSSGWFVWMAISCLLSGNFVGNEAWFEGVAYSEGFVNLKEGLG